MIISLLFVFPCSFNGLTIQKVPVVHMGYPFIRYPGHSSNIQLDLGHQRRAIYNPIHVEDKIDPFGLRLQQPDNTVKCAGQAALEKVGGRAKDGYGAWWICKAQLENVKPSVISIGIGEDTSFDQQMVEKYGAYVYGFDPTPKSRIYVDSQRGAWKDGFHFEAFGVGIADGEAKLVLPENSKHVSGRVGEGCNTCERVKITLKTLQSLVKLTGGSKVDILKMDVEGMEYQVLDSLENTSCDDLPFGQLLVEYHDLEKHTRDLQRQETMLAKCGFHKFNVGKEEGVFVFVK